MVVIVERCPTGIQELDRLLGGGIPKGSIILLTGRSGSGKSVLASKFIFEGAIRYNERGLIANLVEPKKVFYEFINTLGIDLGFAESKNLVKYLDLTNNEDAHDVINVLKREIEVFNPGRLVIDSVSSLLSMCNSTVEFSKVLRELILGVLRRSSVTSILVFSLESPRDISKFIEPSLVDGVIHLGLRESLGFLIRELRLFKLKGVKIPSRHIPFEIVPGEGIRLHVPIRIEEVPSLSKEAYSFDNDIINKALGGGIRKGAQVALVSEEPKVGFILSLCIAKSLAMKYGGKLLIRSYTLSPKEIESLMDMCGLVEDILLSPNRRSSPKKFEKYITAHNLTSKHLYILASENRLQDLKLKEEFLVVDTFELIPADFKEVIREHVNNVWLRRKLSITTFYNFHVSTLREHPELFNIYDYIVVLRPHIHIGKPCIKITIVCTERFMPPSELTVCYDELKGKYILAPK